MTKKKLTQVPTESQSNVNINYKDYFLDQIAQLDCTTLHFFDESGVKITSGNRVYGNSYIGEPAIEVQRYASNANYTLNLLHSIQGVDYYNILRGASNGMEMLNFFDEALAVERADGSPILELRYCIIMDNCGFHHRHQVEPLLSDIFQEHIVSSFVPAFVLVPPKYLRVLLQPGKMLPQTKYTAYSIMRLKQQSVLFPK